MIDLFVQHRPLRRDGVPTPYDYQMRPWVGFAAFGATLALATLIFWRVL